ncbi:hypothetical protein RclHR1_28850003 [Rhizophagus clarus]|uniref:Integrase catalytic domain-containing protein n=1 Tax=Rhizophagus clarus TaxID=94130 RepID=A0A2Z6RYN7_9GLOM|nr:hypothetical protein RclHR1_28850003 [Rhizophagus clarus]
MYFNLPIFTNAEPIKNKFTNSVIKAFIKIYGRGRIQSPTHRLETDSGSEFTNSQIRDFFLNSIGVMMRFGKPEHHKQQSYTERAIQAIEEPLLKRMTAQELKTGETSVEWSEDFYDIFRIGDIKWNPKVHIIKKLILSTEQPSTYLLDGPHGRLGVSRCAYTRKELQVISINEKPLPDSVIKGQPKRYVSEKILNHRTRKERTDIFQIHEITCNIIYYLDQLAEEDYWKAVVNYKNSDEELEHAFKKYLDTNKALKDSLYKKFIDLANKKEKAFVYQDRDRKNYVTRWIYSYEILIFHDKPEETIWQSDYWEDKDPDDPTNWQSEYSKDPSDSDEDPD